MNDYLNFLRSDEYTYYNSLSEDEALELKFEYTKKLFPLDDKILTPDNVFPLNIAELRMSSELEFIQEKMRTSLRKILEHFRVKPKGNDINYIKFFKIASPIFCRIISSLVYHNLIKEAIMLTFRLARYRCALRMIQQTSFSPWEVSYLQAVKKLKEYGIEHEEPPIV